MSINLTARKNCKGFTLVELVVVMVLSGILAGIVTGFITTPIDAFVAQSNRAELVDIADGALDRMSRDLRDALPNSIRIACGGTCIEFLHSFAGGRYRATLDTVNPSDLLSFNPADNDTGFDWLGPDTGVANVVPVAVGSNCIDVGATCLVIYNTGTGSGDAYSGANVAAVTNATAGAPNTVTFSFPSSGFGLGQTAFPGASPEQRFYLVDTPVSYLCTGGAITRYYDYSINATQPTTAAILGGFTNPADSAVLATFVTGCTFSYTAGTSSRNALVTIRLELTQDGETVVLHQQVQVANTP